MHRELLYTEPASVCHIVPRFHVVFDVIVPYIVHSIQTYRFFGRRKRV